MIHEISPQNAKIAHLSAFSNENSIVGHNVHLYTNVP